MSGIVKYSQIATAATSSEVDANSRLAITVDMLGTPTTKYLTGEVLKEVIRDEFGDFFLVAGTGVTVVHDDALNTFTISVTPNTYQPIDAGLTSIAGLTTAADKMIYTTASDTYAVTDLSSFARTILDDADALTARATLGLVINTDVQAYSANLDALAADPLTATTAASTYLTIATAASTYQPLDADLTAIAALPSADGNFIVGSATGWVAESGATARTSLGLGTTDSPTFAGLTSTGAISVPEAVNIYLDGGSDTYIYSPSADRADIVAGGLQIANFTNSAGTRIFAAQGNITAVGTATIASDLTLASGSITSASGAISFGNENLSTTGKWTIGDGLVVSVPTVIDVANQASASILFGNNGTSLPSIVGKTTAANTQGLFFIAATNNSNTEFDFEFNIRESDGTDYGTTTGAGFRWRRFATELAKLDRAGNLTLTAGGSITTTGTLASGNATVTGTLTATSVLVSGANPSLVGQVRLPNNTSIGYRNATNTDNILALTVNSSDVVVLGSNAPSISLAQNTSVTGTLTTTGRIYSTNGSAALPTYSFSGDANTGMYQVGGDSIGFATNATLALTLDSSQNATFAGAIQNTSTGTSYFSQPTALVLGATATSSNAQFYATKTYSAASGDTYHAYFRPEQSVASTGWLFGSYSRPSATHTSGTVASVVGYQSLVEQSGAGGTVTALYGIRVNVSNLNATAVTTSAYGLRIESFTATGTITNRWAIYSAETGASYLAGSLRIGTTSAAGNEILRVNGLIHSDSDSIIIDTAKTPASAGATGTQGQIAWDSDYIYVAVGSNTWKRAALSTWP